ncbi:unnamed protein product [Didymodactylos carnosus]|uniref:Uncharacterized protein n=1 Tax=Didymodactylos carnosus TaxID=1234261 RepID=A0A814ZCC5_9BILA|nr:unnamed protein product [Didymodactylos carnosus]CAF4004954.1 unnamed protein product [Didymodactylos carnosus]
MQKITNITSVRFKLVNNQINVGSMINSVKHKKYTLTLPLELIAVDKKKAKDLINSMKVFHQILAQLKTAKEKKKLSKNLELKLMNDIEDWSDKYSNQFGLDRITPYVHVLGAHGLEFHQKYDDLTTYSLEGVKKSNDMLTANFFRATNRKNQYFKQMLRNKILAKLLLIDSLTRLQILNEWKQRPQTLVNIDDDASTDSEYNSDQDEIIHEQDESDSAQNDSKVVESLEEETDPEIEKEQPENVEDDQECSFKSDEKDIYYCSKSDLFQDAGGQEMEQIIPSSATEDRSTYHPYVEKFEEDFISARCGETIAQWKENFSHPGKYDVQDCNVIDPITNKSEKIYTLRALTAHHGAVNYHLLHKQAKNNQITSGHFTPLIRLDNDYFEYDDISGQLNKFKTSQRGILYESAVYSL